MPLTAKIDEFFTIFKNEKCSLYHTKKIKAAVNNAIKQSVNIEELDNAVRFISHLDDGNTSERTIHLDLVHIGKFMLIGGSFGAGLGFFSSLLATGVVIGFLFGIEIAMLTINSRRSSINKMACEFEELIRMRIVKLKDSRILAINLFEY